MASRYRYERMTGEEMQELAEAAGVQGQALLRLLGSDPTRVKRWISGEEDIPHHVGLVMTMLVIPAARDAAWEYVDSVISLSEKEESRRQTYSERKREG